MSAKKTNADPSLESLSLETDDLSMKYIEMNRGIVKIAAQLDILKEIRADRRDQMLLDIEELSKSLENLKSKSVADGMLFRDVDRIKQQSERLAKDCDGLTTRVNEFERESGILSSEHKHLTDDITVVKEKMEDVTTEVVGHNESHIKCRSGTTRSLEDICRWREDEVAPVLARANRMWWTVIGVNLMVGFLIAILTVAVLVRQLNSAEKEPDLGTAVLSGDGSRIEMHSVNCHCVKCSPTNTIHHN